MTPNRKMLEKIKRNEKSIRSRIKKPIDIWEVPGQKKMEKLPTLLRWSETNPCATLGSVANFNICESPSMDPILSEKINAFRGVPNAKFLLFISIKLLNFLLDALASILHKVLKGSELSWSAFTQLNKPRIKSFKTSHKYRWKNNLRVEKKDGSVPATRISL